MKTKPPGPTTARGLTTAVPLTRRAAAVLRDAIAIVRRAIIEPTAEVTTRPASTSGAIAEEIAMAIASEIAIVIVTGIETEIAIVTEIWLVDFDTMIAIAGAS